MSHGINKRQTRQYNALRRLVQRTPKLLELRARPGVYAEIPFAVSHEFKRLCQSLNISDYHALYIDKHETLQSLRAM